MGFERAVLYVLAWTGVTSVGCWLLTAGVPLPLAAGFCFVASFVVAGFIRESM